MSRRIFNDANHDAVFREKGFVVVNLLTPEDVESLLRIFKVFEDAHEGGFTATVLADRHDVRQQVHNGLQSVFAKRVLPVLHNYRMVLGSFAVKRARSEFSRVGLHQDFSFVRNEGDEVGISIWSPLVEVNGDNGWLGVVPGSQVLNSNYREPCSLPYPELYELIEQNYLTFLPMQPGQVLLMDNRVFHGSPCNTTATDRVVAAGIAVPGESQLIYCHHDPAVDPGVLEMFSVPDDFLLRHQVGNRPSEGSHIDTVPRIVSDLTEADLMAASRVAVAR